MNGLKYQHEYSRMIIYLFDLDFVSLSFYGSEFNSLQKAHNIVCFIVSEEQ